MKASQRSVGILSYGLIVMTVTHTLTHVFQRIHLALFPTIRREFNLSLQQLGVIAAIPFLCQALLGIPTGLLSDRFGSKRMIILSFTLAILGSLLASQTINPEMLTVAVSLVYINTVMYHPASYSFTTKMFRPRDRSKALGIHGAGGTLGMALGPISVSILMGIFALGWRQVYLFWAFPILLGMLAVSRLRSEPTEDLKEDGEIGSKIEGGSIFTSSMIFFLFYTGLRNMAAQMIEVFLPIYLVENRRLGEALASLVFGSSSLLGLAAAPIGGAVASRLGEKRWLMISLGMAYICLGAAVISPGVAGFVILYLAYGFCNTLGMAANSAIVASLSPSRRRGLGYSLFFLPGEVMGVVAPVIAAYIASGLGLTSIFIIGLAIYAGGLAVLKAGVKV
ncbi:MAG: MFS transporter [Candidatus Bathyarchaeia archaeon]|nr:MFS transporter [Candidatus Bathyarchaeota archaeon]